ncbi:curli production assembly/transport component CsgF [Rubrivirga sp.]|uniref:curli production assembly/transport component CsgF n=1 Tax=Rubrivirga sp. TaxID=1885344 RepID=UPI003C74AFDD
MRLVLLAAVAFAVSPAVSAQQLTYQPTNPAFGGSPLNYGWLVQSAQLQNSFDDADDNRFRRDPLADFEQSLQRQILNQLSRELISNRFGDLDLTQPGTFDLGDFQIEVIPGIDGVSIRIFNLLTGEETIVTVPNGF